MSEPIKKPESITTAKEALELIQAAYLAVRSVPESQWIEGNWTDGQRCCFMGHYSRLTNGAPNDYSHSNCERPEDGKLMGEAFGIAGLPHIININDDSAGTDHAYKFDHPKKRTIAAAEDAMEKLCTTIKAEDKPQE